MSYADILKTAKEGISLTELGISNPRIRKAANGGIIIEVRGADSASKADSLANKLREVVGQVAHVARPYAKGEILLVGLDESVSREEIVAAVVGAGKCREDNVRVGPIRPMRNGLGPMPPRGSEQTTRRGPPACWMVVSEGGTAEIANGAMFPVLASGTCTRNMQGLSRQGQELF